MRKLPLLAGFAAGYVLGAKAGKERYEQIMSKVREVSGRPEVQDLTQRATETATAAADTAKAKANETVEKVAEKAQSAQDDVVDLSASTTSPTSSTPRAGAAASDTV